MLCSMAAFDLGDAFLELAGRALESREAALDLGDGFLERERGTHTVQGGRLGPRRGLPRGQRGLLRR